MSRNRPFRVPKLPHGAADVLFVYPRVEDADSQEISHGSGANGSLGFGGEVIRES